MFTGYNTENEELILAPYIAIYSIIVVLISTCFLLVYL
jgi:hypothetical protein